MDNTNSRKLKKIKSREKYHFKEHNQLVVSHKKAVKGRRKNKTNKGKRKMGRGLRKKSFFCRQNLK